MQNYTSNDNQFSSYDLGLAASLVCSGFPVDYLDKSNPHKVGFFFQRIDGLDQAIQLYWADQLQVPALSYFNAIKMLKNRIYSE
jgi:hypothetical protein